MMDQGPYVPVTQEAFFAIIGPLDVHPSSERQRTLWETPSRAVIGISTPGYLCEGSRTYAVRATLVKAKEDDNGKS